jgi:5,6,7,8-tetrahydromethanopterin hydro-lyase
MTMTADELDGRLGEAWSGNRPNGSHINVAIARRGSPTAAAIVGALAAPRPGHVPFMAVLEPGVLTRPITVVVNKVTIGPDPHGPITWGAGQLGVSQGVLDAVADGVIGEAVAGSIVLLVALWVDAAASDETAVRKASREATRAALEDAVTNRNAEFVRSVVDRREHASSYYYRGN